MRSKCKLLSYLWDISTVSGSIACAACDVQEGNSRCDFCQKVVDYFHHGYPYDAIVGLLRRDGFAISVRTLKRKLVELGLSRKRNIIEEEAITQLIRQEIQGAGTLAGYHTIWHALRLKHEANVPQNLVARIVGEIDPEGVELRKSRRLTRRRCMSLGPNFCWHIDG